MKQNTNQIFKAEDLDWKELETAGIHKERTGKATGTWNCSCKVKQQKPCH